MIEQAKQVAQRLKDAWTCMDDAADTIDALVAEIERLKEYSQWYDEAMVASNEAGFSGMSAEQTIREQAAEIERLLKDLAGYQARCLELAHNYNTLLESKNLVEPDGPQHFYGMEPWEQPK
jgi:FtsZ-binding cell division protein ZapB